MQDMNSFKMFVLKIGMYKILFIVNNKEHIVEVSLNVTLINGSTIQHLLARTYKDGN